MYKVTLASIALNDLNSLYHHKLKAIVHKTYFTSSKDAHAVLIRKPTQTRTQSPPKMVNQCAGDSVGHNCGQQAEITQLANSPKHQHTYNSSSNITTHMSSCALVVCRQDATRTTPRFRATWKDVVARTEAVVNHQETEYGSNCTRKPMVV